jgi:hypothetical protein
VAVDVCIGVAEGSMDGKVIVAEAEGRATGCENSPRAPLQAVTRRINGNIKSATVVNGFFSRIMYFRQRLS